MGKKYRQAGQIVQPTPPAATAVGVALAQAEAKATEAKASVLETPQAVVEAATPNPVEILEQAIAGLPPEQAAKAREYISKLRADADRTVQSKAFAEFNVELEKALPAWLVELAGKHKVSLFGRKITVAFPKPSKPEDEAVGKVSHTPIGAKSDGNGKGFPGTWGKALLISKDGKEHSYDSPSQLAGALQLQVEGMRDMLDVFQNPTRPHGKGEDKVFDPRKFKVDAERGKHFRVTLL